jgi:peptidoglycan/LPS O-acetylase OafA/YrhL
VGGADRDTARIETPAVSSSRTAPARPPYFASIDGLRLVAAVNIVLFHFEGVGGFADMGGSPGWFFRVVKGPMFHASLFFMLAGFIYTVKYAGKASGFRTRSLLAGRFRDLYPLHALTTLAMVPFLVIGGVGKVSILLSCGVHLGMAWSFFPYFTHPLNRPSWALSAFFLCYLLFGPALRRVVSLTSRRAVAAMIAGCFIPATLWSLLYGAVGSEYHYPFFHMFAPIRFFEFLLGMLLARLYFLNDTKPRRLRVSAIPALNDLLIIAGLLACFWIIGLRRHGLLLDFLSYHVFLLAPFALLLYRLARGDGLIGWLFARPLIRNLGKSSFYPYLLHVPLASWLCFVLERTMGYRRFLHSPRNVWLLVAVLYAGSMMYMKVLRKKKRPTYRGEVGAPGRA